MFDQFCLMTSLYHIFYIRICNKNGLLLPPSFPPYSLQGNWDLTTVLKLCRKQTSGSVSNPPSPYIWIQRRRLSAYFRSVYVDENETAVPEGASMCITTHQRYIARVDSQNLLQISVIIAEATVTMGRQHISMIALSVTLLFDYPKFPLKERLDVWHAAYCCVILKMVDCRRCIIEYILSIQ